MYCSNCGKQVADTAKFCPNCGYSLAKESGIGEPRWETCEILCQDILKPAGMLFGGATIRFSVEAVGKNGRYRVANSDPFEISKQEYLLGSHFIPPEFIPRANNPKVVAALDKLVSHLTSNNWESVGRGQKWFSYKFRRVIK